MTLSYREAINLLLSLADFERRSRVGEPPDWHLKRVGALLSRLGDPHLAVPVVHVAGSKGKGSTSAMTAAILEAHGVRTGLYISPHLHSFTERIQSGGLQLSEAAFAALFEKLWPDVEAVGAAGDLGRVSVFEMLTGMAFVHFRDAGCGAAVVEVGLGGRLDATNLVLPRVSVITPISLDHVRILGDTIAKIAGEKAGIIKAGIPVVTGRQEPEAARVFQQAADRLGAPLTEAMSAVRLVSDEAPGEGPQRLLIRGRLGEYRVTLPLLGAHQADNARTAIAAVEALDGQTVRVDRAAVEVGLAGVRWPARCEVIASGPPLVLADGAHNDASARALVRTLDRHFSSRAPVVFVIGGTSGHDFVSTARLLSAKGRLIVTQSRHPKAVPASELAQALRAAGVAPLSEELTTAAALQAAMRKAAGPGGMVVATGSLFVAAEAREELLGIEPELYPDLKSVFSLPYTATVV